LAEKWRQKDAGLQTGESAFFVYFVSFAVLSSVFIRLSVVGKLLVAAAISAVEFVGGVF
jgi:hypothetical protein